MSNKGRKKQKKSLNNIRKHLWFDLFTCGTVVLYFQEEIANTVLLNKESWLCVVLSKVSLRCHFQACFLPLTDWIVWFPDISNSLTLARAAAQTVSLHDI